MKLTDFPWTGEAWICERVSKDVYQYIRSDLPMIFECAEAAIPEEGEAVHRVRVTIELVEEEEK